MPPNPTDDERPVVDPRIRDLAEEVTAKRPRTVIDHLFEFGSINTEELQELYGYTHPPRAIRDVREAGIPIESRRVVSPLTGRRITEYRFGHPDEVVHGRHAGRRALPASLKDRLIEEFGEVDQITGQQVPARMLQMDHRVPYEIAGDPKFPFDPSDFMLLDASTQRSKSTACTECPNMISERSVSTCLSCYWANPDDHQHVATLPVRRVDVVWHADEVADHDALVAFLRDRGVSVPAMIKSVVRRLLGKDK